MPNSIPPPPLLLLRDGLRGCSDNLNKRHHNAQMAGRASVELHTLIFFNGRTVVADARITKVSVGRGRVKGAEGMQGKREGED